jgi:2-polyprenyl-3-methyl-5-hydroxy-6-metoxy-1,4-benzoquinol methylase
MSPTTAVANSDLAAAPAGYGWRTAEPTCSSPYVLPAVRRVLADIGAPRVLDIGSGNGALCAELARHGHAVMGLETDAQGAAIATAAHPALRFVHGSVEDDPQALLAGEAPFDAVVSTEVIEHLYSPHHLPRFAGAVLRDGGHLVLTTPYHGYAKNLALSLFDKWDHHHTALWHGGHIKFWSRRTLTQLLHENGFEVVRFVGLGRAPWLWCSMLLVARKR